ncbi:hypothetical protein E2C01_014157 [Portunus trituberculatus]|uniref:Uncharacterized protein n=1 Tax=Portunus trituberculatus TaxID=210409 RepID=A0A5B7DI22_PORTR|nr:hypothetical protein [Portunus trituberculatus]
MIKWREEITVTCPLPRTGNRKEDQHSIAGDTFHGSEAEEAEKLSTYLDVFLLKKMPSYAQLSTTS